MEILKKIIIISIALMTLSSCIGTKMLKFEGKTKSEMLNKFGYPNKFPNEGFFWSNSSSEQKINKLLKNILCMKQSTFNKKTNMIKDKIMCFDPKNTKFKRLLCVV